MMSRKLALVVVSLLVGVVSAFADEAAELRKKLPQLQDTVRLAAYERLYNLSLMTDDTDQQMKALYDWLGEARRQHEVAHEGFVYLCRTSFFYNNDMNDSIYAHVPEDLGFLKRHKIWKGYFEMWAYLGNTYIYSGQANIGLREVHSMFEEATQLHDNYGMGLAYVGMGNAYMVLGSLDECVDAYRKGLDILLKMDLLPAVITEVYPNYADVLNDQHSYDKLVRLTDEWKEFLQRFLKSRKGELSEDGYQVTTYWSYYYLARAQAFLGQEDLEEAAKALDEARQRLVSEEDYIGQKYLFYRAQLSFKQGKYIEALALNKRRMQQMEETDDKSVLIMVRQQRAEILEKLGLYAEAARLYREMYVINDSINASDIKNQLSEMNTLFHVNEIEMEKERAQFTFTIVVVSVVLLALAIFLVFRIKAAKRLKVAHDKLEKTHNDLLVAYDNLEETTAAKERIESDLRIARDIQMSMVPSVFPNRPDLDIYASMTPAKAVGGDLYDFLLLDDYLYFCLGDVSGKGVPASLFMAQATRLFHTLAKLKMQPAEIATRLNDELGADNEQGMFVTMFLGFVDLTNGHLCFCNAGHNPPVLLADDGCRFLEMIPNAPIGLWPGLEYEGEEIDCVRDQPLFIYTDGLNEAENRQQQQFTDERLLELLETRPFENAQQTVEMLREEVEKHRDGAEPNDDLTMLCFKVKKEKPIDAKNDEKGD